MNSHVDMLIATFDKVFSSDKYSIILNNYHLLPFKLNTVEINFFNRLYYDR